MGIFTDFVSEKNAEIDPFVLFSQLAAQEGDEVKSIAAYFYRHHYFPHRCQGEIDTPSYPAFCFYKFSVCDGFFIPNDEFDDSFQESCLLMLRGVSEGYYLEDEPDSQGFYHFDRLHGYNLPTSLQSRSFEMFCFHKNEMIEFLTSQGIKLPECLLPQGDMSKNVSQGGSVLNLQSMSSTLEVTFVNGKCGYDEAISPLEEENRKLKEENLSLKDEVLSLKEQLPLHINAFDEADPLALAIEIRNKFWVNYDPENDRQTRPKSPVILQYLAGRGVEKERRAKAIDLVASPINRDPSKDM